MSVCLHCQHKRVITSGKGTSFILCQFGVNHASWPKYPPQPLYACPHYAPKNDPPQQTREASPLD